MKAIVWTKYGPPDVLQLKEVEKPVPKEDEVLVKIHATTVTAGDCEMRRLELPLFLSFPMRFYTGLRKPNRITILGQELAGEIEAVGKKVNQFKPGDQVFAAPGFQLGAYAEYICIPEESKEGVLAIKPTNMTFEEAAAVPVGGLEALHFIKNGHIKDGQRMLINGAGGSIGTFAVQLAKYLGADVTAVDNTAKLDMLRSIGADQVIDYTQEDFTKRGDSYDVILDIVGKSPFSGSLKSLKPNGRYLIANPGLLHMVRGFWTSLTNNKKVIIGAASYKTKDLIYLRDLIERGKIKSIIDRRYPLEKIVEAHYYVELGLKKGNVVITIEHSNNA